MAEPKMEGGSSGHMEPSQGEEVKEEKREKGGPQGSPKEEEEAEEGEHEEEEENYQSFNIPVQPHVVRLMASSVIASSLSWYSWGLYTIASELGKVSHSAAGARNTSHSVIIPLGLAGRVVGSSIFGQRGDTKSRPSGIVPSLIITALATMAMGLFPPEAISVFPAWWGILRFTQGVGVGGHWPGTVLLAYEAAGHNQWIQPVAASIAQAGLGFGLAGAVGAFMWVLHNETCDPGKWAVVFLASSILLPVALGIYRWGGGLAAEQREGAGPPSLQVLKSHLGMCLIASIYLSIEALGLAVLSSGWWTLWPESEEGLLEVMYYIALSLLIMGVVTIVFGLGVFWWWKNRTKYVGSALVLGGAIVLWFYLVKPQSEGGPHDLSSAYLLTLGPALGIVEGCVITVLADQFDKSVRYTALGLAYHGCHLIIEGFFPWATRALLAAGQKRRLGGANIDAGFLGMTVVITAIVSAVMAVWAGNYIRPAFFSTKLSIRDAVAITIRGKDTRSEGEQQKEIEKDGGNGWSDRQAMFYRE